MINLIYLLVIGCIIELHAHKNIFKILLFFKILSFYDQQSKVKGKAISIQNKLS